jgi:outer membrane protein assembly factor BamE (lipoprotein component of BamABCDE complex)
MGTKMATAILSLRRTLSVIVIASLLGLAGCLVSSDTHTSQSGKYVSDRTWRQIDEGETSAAWVEATLGEPTERKRMDDGTEIWRWNYTEHQSSSGHVFLLFDGSSSKERQSAAIIELKDGVVVKKWRA